VSKLILHLSLFISLWVNSNELKPEFRKSGIDAETKYCASENYPISKDYYKNPCSKVGSFTNFDKLYPSVLVDNGDSIWEIKYADNSLRDSPLAVAIDNLLNQHPVMALIVWRDGQIIREVYQYDRKDTNLYHSFSMHKTVTAFLVDIAINQGLINSLEDKVTDYIPELNETDWKDVTIFQALTMTSGFENHNGKLYTELLFKDGDRLKTIKDLYHTRKYAFFSKINPGEKFIYSDANTYVLGLILERVYKEDYADILSQLLWRKVGFESVAKVTTTKSGQHMVAANLLARPRDFLRLGLLVLNDGRNHLDEQIISPEWIDGLFGKTQKTSKCPYGRGCRGGYGYSYQAWLPPTDNTVSFIGRYGQYIHINKDTNTVVVINAVDDPVPTEKRPLILELFNAASIN